MNIVEMRQKKARLWSEAKALHEGAKNENRALGEQEEAKWTELMGQIDALGKEIEREERLEDLGAQLEERQGRPIATLSQPEKEKPFNPVFRSLGEQLMAVRQAAVDPGHIDSRLYEVRAPLGAEVATPSEGGYLMETQYSAGLWKRVYEQGEILRRCFKVPIGDRADSVVINGIDETSRATGSRWGGVRAYWVAEGGTITASQPTFRRMTLAPKKLAVIVYATSEMLRNPGALEGVVSQVVPQEIMFMAEDGVFIGTGAGMPQGIMNATCRIDVDKESGQLADTVVLQNVNKMWSRMWARSRANAIWMINQDVEPQLDELALNIGASGVPVYLPSGGVADAPYARLKGRPVMPFEYCDTVGDLGDIVLADWSQYVISDRGGINAASSIHVQFLTDQTAFRFTYEIDGQPLWSAALTPKNSSTTLSPFIALAARA